MNKDPRKNLRSSLRQARHDINSEGQIKAAEDLHDSVVKQDFFNEASRLAFYLSFDSEIDPTLIMRKALTEGKFCYLPVISEESSSELSFAPFHQGTKLTPNKWGISEPTLPQIPIPLASLDVVFVPLVGFNKYCFRLGMGKGFYDRAFSFKSAKRHRKPLLVGLAHECQLTDDILAASWDVRLEMVITPKRIYRADSE